MKDSLYYEVALSIFVGLFCGLAAYFKGFMDGHSHYKPSVRKAIANMLTSSVMSFIVFAILDSSGLSLMTKLAICGAVAFLGIDKALDTVFKLMNLYQGKKIETK